MTWLWMLCLAIGAGPARAQPDPPPIFVGPDHSEIPILRPSPGFPRIYVQARMPDGERALFLVDTGADVSVIRKETAERLGLTPHATWQLEGLSGQVSTEVATLPALEIGDMVVPEVQVALGVTGLSDTVEFMPLEGLLGNNVWGRFTLEIDYPADVIVLHRPGTTRVPRTASVMWYDGHHTFTPITLTAAGDPPREDTLIAQVDTGASRLFVCAATGLPFAGLHTEGVEPVFGIGATATLPPYRFFVTTRHIPLSGIELGGKKIATDAVARWRDFDKLNTHECRSNYAALLGHEFLADHRVIFDYHRGRLSLTRSRRKPHSANGHAVLLAQDIERYGADVPERALYRARLHVGNGALDDAIALLGSHADSMTEDDLAEHVVLLARLYRLKGELDKTADALGQLSPGMLVDQDEIVGAVNALLFEGRPDAARALADAAIEARPDAGWARVARADVHLYNRDAQAASNDLLAAATLEEYPDAHLLRRARVALAAGDRFGSMAHIRRLLQLYPMVGQHLWFYAMLIEDEREADTFRQDMEQAMTRLHPDSRPVDFMVAAHRTLGDDKQAIDLMHEGISAHCETMEAALKDNCLAWYYSLAGAHPEEALRRIEGALAETGDTSEFLDTKAMVHLARGEVEQAFAAAHEAARLSPDDPYMLWQAERIGDLYADRGGDPAAWVAKRAASTGARPRP